MSALPGRITISRPSTRGTVILRTKLRSSAAQGAETRRLIDAIVERLEGRYRAGVVREDEGGPRRDKAEELFLPSLYQGYDLLLVEGGARSDMAKIAVLDPSLTLLEEARSGALTNVIACVGPAGSAAVVGGKQAAGPAVRGARGLSAGDLPLFGPEDIAGIAECLLDHVRARALAAPLYGLVLTGGSSTRMNRDKAGIEYHGIPQARYAAHLLEGICSRVFISLRVERASDPLFAGCEVLPDTFVGFGPMGGILSAFHAYPHAAWLVLGCDLPYVTAGTLRRLVEARDPLKLATAYLSPEDRLPEPLVALYEPAYRRRLHQFLAEGRNCPRKSLINSRFKAVETADPNETANINNPEEYERALLRLSEEAAPGGVAR